MLGNRLVAYAAVFIAADLVIRLAPPGVFQAVGTAVVLVVFGVAALVAIPVVLLLLLAEPLMLGSGIAHNILKMLRRDR